MMASSAAVASTVKRPGSGQREPDTTTEDIVVNSHPGVPILSRSG
jgi:hypothetical protein